MPKLNKNTDKYLEARRKRIEEEGPNYKSKRHAEVAEKTATKITDKHLLNKFNREFDSIAEAIIDITELEVDLMIN